MTACVVCNHAAVFGEQKLPLDDINTNLHGLMLRARLAQVMEEAVLREDGWMCTPCHFALSQIEMYYSMLLVFRQKYWDTTQLWEHKQDTKNKEPTSKNMVLNNLDFSSLNKQGKNNGGSVSEHKNFLTSCSQKTEEKPEEAQPIDATGEMAAGILGAKPQSDQLSSVKSSENGQSKEQGSEEELGDTAIETVQDEYTDDETEIEDDSPDLSDYEDCSQEDAKQQVQKPKAKRKSKISDEEDDWKPAQHYTQRKSYVYKTKPKEPLPCPICNKVLQNASSLKIHMKTHDIPKPTCPICNKTFRKESVYMAHMRTHARMDGKTFSCYICNEEFDKVSDYKAHMKVHREESSQVKPNECPICPKKFLQSIDLKRHMMIHTGERPYICNVCGKAFIRPVSLKRHMPSHSDERPYVCEICGHKFKSDIYLKVHVKGHTEAHECAVCNGKFITRDSLKMHMLTHTDEKHFPCEVCGRRFRQLAHVRAHMQTHNTDKAPAKFICSTCGKTFAVRTQLRYHMMTHTGEWKCVCSVCGKGCVNEYVLKRHMICHTGEKPTKCPVCGKGFTHGGNVTQHMLTHTGEKPHQCSVCGAAYTCKYKMRKHVLKKHAGVAPV